MELKKNFYAPLTLFLTIFVAIFIWLGVYNWGQIKSGEDFFFAEKVSSLGFWDFQKYFFFHENGRFLNGLSISLCVLFSLPTVYKFLPAFTILTYAFCVWFFIKIFTPPQKDFLGKIIFFSLS